MKVTVLAKPDCVQCDFTKTHLNKHGIEYDVVDITVDADARQKAIDLGYFSAPVVIVEADGEVAHWSGFKPGRIEALGAEAGVSQ
ncbi:glutaredoxin domain-containing protein [Rhodococcus erythropolis]|uniref:glutaredoxin domain-containing protein n=1 Tax=Rhodococcus erythropolis TaxID=1833 RepID=UPI002948EAB6|nr:glutaredoxin domain-containing protein [Rhodococcus erythropolis]MDV6277261.1 glutaredoxin domain-containing protein [Rhodococcus erythropolis]